MEARELRLVQPQRPMLEIPALLRRLPRLLERAGGVERQAAAREQPEAVCWQITLYLRLLRLGGEPVQRGPVWAAEDRLWEHLSTQDQL